MKIQEIISHKRRRLSKVKGNPILEKALEEDINRHRKEMININKGKNKNRKNGKIRYRKDIIEVWNEEIS